MVAGLRCAAILRTHLHRTHVIDRCTKLLSRAMQACHIDPPTPGMLPGLSRVEPV